MNQPLSLSPEEITALIDCPLHYHFLQQKSALPPEKSSASQLDSLVKEIIYRLHAGGGPARLSLRSCLRQADGFPEAQRLVERYYQRLRQDWSQVMASHEMMSLRISIAGAPLILQGTIDRLDKTPDGGIVALLIRTGSAPLPTAEQLRQDPALTIYHALVATTYPLKRPVRLRELWLAYDQAITLELSEDEYRHNLSRLREPIRGLARGEVRARPGLHCEACAFKYHGCPVYARDPESENPEDNFDPASPGGKIPPRQWIFKI